MTAASVWRLEAQSRRGWLSGVTLLSHSYRIMNVKACSSTLKPVMWRNGVYSSATSPWRRMSSIRPARCGGEEERRWQPEERRDMKKGGKLGAGWREIKRWQQR